MRPTAPTGAMRPALATSRGGRNPAGSRGRSSRVGLVALLVAASAVGAQEPERERGWLGVGLHEVMECREEARPGPRPCGRRLVVAQVVVGSPAARAGVAPGDTLLALDDRPLTDLDPATRERTFATVRAGEAVSLRVGRSGGRRTLRLEPARRPASAEFRWAPAAPPPGIVAPEAAAAPVVVGGAAGPPPGAGGYVIALRTDSGDVVSIRRWPDGDRSPVMTADSVFMLHLDGDGPTLPDVRVELGPEFRALRDSTLRQARVRVDSLQRKARLRQATRTETVPHLRAALAEARDRRLAGAEFSPLSEALADYFYGVGEGLLVLRVLPGTPADRLGLRPGDVVVEAAGRPIREVGELREALRYGDSLRVRWIRKGEPVEGSLPRR